VLSRLLGKDAELVAFEIGRHCPAIQSLEDDGTAPKEVVDDLD
jgi:hypothetical protein